MATTLIRHHSRKRWLWALLPVALVALAVVWWVRQPIEPGQQPAATADSGRSAWPTAPSSTSDDEADKLLFSKEHVGEAKPADFTQNAWDTLNKALADNPKKDEERNRLVSYLRFQRAVTKWGEMTNGPSTPERVELARQVMQDMPTHVVNGEINPGEAMMAVTAMAMDLEPDEAKRAAWIEAQRARMKATETPEQAKAARDEQDKVKQFEAEKDAITARWMSSHEPGSDPATLQEQIDALRSRTFGSPAR
ncbi:MAG: hypothetical protein QM749_08395 [Aquabacterium sp.]